MRTMVEVMKMEGIFVEAEAGGRCGVWRMSMITLARAVAGGAAIGPVRLSLGAALVLELAEGGAQGRPLTSVFTITSSS